MRELTCWIQAFMEPLFESQYAGDQHRPPSIRLLRRLIPDHGLPFGALSSMTTERIRGRAGVRARALFLAQNPLCIHCAAKGITRAAVEVDHVVPLHKGGSDDPSNKAACCKSCHAAKTAVDMGHAPKGADITGWPTSAAHHWNQP